VSAGWWLGWKLVRVRGRSMLPTLGDGDYVIVRQRDRGRAPGEGDVVCLSRRGEPRLIKRLGAASDDGRFRLSGDGAASQPSIDLGTVAARDIEGRVVARITGSSIRRVARR
jgi:phage repressor protein C with HTH and peptisase S24 domain